MTADEVTRAELWQRQRDRRAAHRRAVMADLAGDRQARLLLDDDWAPLIAPEHRHRILDTPPL